MPALHETRLGQHLIEVTLPRIATELANIATSLNALHTLLRERLPPAPPASPSRPPAPRT